MFAGARGAGRQGCRYLIVGWGGTYGPAGRDQLRDSGKKVALALRHINPLPKNTHELLKQYKKVIVAEQNTGS